jgi:hypothetical protein
MGYRTTDPVVRRPITTQPIGNVRRIGPKPEDVAAFNEALAASVSGAQFRNGTMPAFFYNPSASRRGRTLSRQLRQPAGSYVNPKSTSNEQRLLSGKRSPFDDMANEDETIEGFTSAFSRRLAANTRPIPGASH